MLDQLKLYLRNTPSAEVHKAWKGIEALGFSGPNAFEYLEFMEQNYKLYLPQFCQSKGINIPENMTPNFSGSSFWSNIAA